MTLSEYLSALEALDKAATEGPCILDEDATHIGVFSKSKRVEVAACEEYADAALIAASRSALPLLCKIVRAQAEVIRLQVSTMYGSTAEKNWKPYREAQSALSTLFAELKI